MPKFRCPNCQTINQQLDEYCGQVVCCTQCQKRVRVPIRKKQVTDTASTDDPNQLLYMRPQEASPKQIASDVDWSQLTEMERTAGVAEDVGLDAYTLRQKTGSPQAGKLKEELGDNPNVDVNSSYTPSGRIGILSIVVMPLGAAVTAGITLLCYSLGLGLLGAAFGFVEAGMRLNFVPKMLGSLGGRACLSVALFSFVGALASLTIGIAVTSRLSKNRSRLFAALFAGATVLMVLGALVINRDPEAAARQIEAAMPKNEQPAPPSLLVLFVRYQNWIEIPGFCVLAFIVASFAAYGVGEQYFCEKCKKYLKEPKCHFWPSGAAEVVSKPLRQKNIPAVLQVMRSEKSLLARTDGECTRMEIRSCPSCGVAVVNVFDVVVVDVTDEGEKVLKETRRASVWVNKKEAHQLKSPHSDRWIPQP